MHDIFVLEYISMIAASCDIRCDDSAQSIDKCCAHMRDVSADQRAFNTSDNTFTPQDPERSIVFGANYY